MADPNSDDTNQRWLGLGMHAILVSIKLGFIAVIAQMNGFTQENKIFVFISFAAIVMNYHVTRWKFTQISDIEQKHWKTLIFNMISTFTDTLFLYSALSIQAPHVFPWYTFPIICTVVALGNVLQFVFNWCYQTLATAVTNMIDQQPTNDAV